jgi:hypothetical protein
LSEPAASARSAGVFVVLREVTPGHWQVVGEASRRPGLTARKARQQAVSDATGGTARAGETYAAVPRSEWRVAQQL